ncbi:DUF3072 domain-containing protein [Nannocystis sp. SCPEA4]|nr:DUF3072 domain-containing protein [Nannocystis sp. SCPEA4]MCY1058962.1 DUF3072 domain-containing protein [Nannocystis sp. SCPEA4]
MRKDNPKIGPRDHDVPSNLEKDPDDWVTGDERMTDAQASYLKTLCEEAHEPFDPSLTKAEASKRIDALQHVTGRGRHDDDTPAGETSAREAPACPQPGGRGEDYSPDDLDE